MYTLLIIDDEQNIIDGLKAMIKWEQLNINKIFEANTFDTAVALLTQYKPDFVISDVQIDDMRGYDLIKYAKKTNIPSNFIMISGYDNFKYIHESLLEGAKEYLLKPVNCQRLIEIIKKIRIDVFNEKIEDIVTDKSKIDPILNVEYTSLSKLTNMMIGIVQHEYAKNINLVTVAETFKMNSKYLGQVFLNETNIKFTEYVLAYRMYIAKDLIENSDQKITAISLDIGYSNTNYFYQHFKSYYGVSPRDLRKETLKSEKGE